MSERRFFFLNTFLAGAVAIAVLAGIHWAANRTVPDAPNPSAAPADHHVPIPAVASMLRSLKLVTVEITAPVRSESIDRSWRGDVEASVTAPVRLFYGVPMDGLADSSVSRDPLGGSWVVHVPQPRRLAIEVFSSSEQPSVRVGGTRLRDVAGEYHLGQARLKLYERAHDMVLSPDQALTVERLSREQIASLVRALIGPEDPVRVEFDRSELTDAQEHPATLDAPR